MSCPTGTCVHQIYLRETFQQVPCGPSLPQRIHFRAGVLTPGPGEPQGVLGSSLLVLESRRVCWGPHSWGPHSWSWGAAGCAGVLTPGPGEPQGGLGSSLLGSSLLVLGSLRVCWGPHSWSWRAAGCAGVLTPGPGEPQGVLGSWGEPQGVLGSSLLVLGSLRVCWGPHSWSWGASGCAGVLTSGPGECALHSGTKLHNCPRGSALNPITAPGALH